MIAAALELKPTVARRGQGLVEGHDGVRRGPVDYCDRIWARVKLDREVLAE